MRHDLKKTLRGSEGANVALLSSSPHGFREIMSFMTLWEQMTWGMANLDPRGRVNIGDH